MNPAVRPTFRYSSQLVAQMACDVMPWKFSDGSLDKTYDLTKVHFGDKRYRTKLFCGQKIYYYPIPHKGMGFCSSLVWAYTIIIILLLPCCSEQLLTLWPSFPDISMKLAGHIGHGPNSSYPDLCPDMSCCHGIMTEHVLKNGQMNVRIVKSQEEMAKIHSYHDTWLPGLPGF